MYQRSNIINEAWCDLTRASMIHCMSLQGQLHIRRVVGVCHLRKLSFIRLRIVICFDQSFLLKPSIDSSTFMRTLCFRFSQDIFGWLPALICDNLTFRCKLKPIPLHTKEWPKKPDELFLFYFIFWRFLYDFFGKETIKQSTRKRVKENRWKRKSKSWYIEFTLCFTLCGGWRLAFAGIASFVWHCHLSKWY